MAIRKVGSAFIGAGIVAEMHGRAIKRNPTSRLVGVYDQKIAASKAIAKKFGGKAYRSIDEILDDPKVELVHVLVPMVFHQDVVIKCLEAGKHVLVEKPVAQEVSELKALKAAAEKAGKVCMPAHNYIYTPSIMRAKRLIDEGKLGDICGLWIFFNIFHDEKIAARYGSVLRETTVHHIYSMLYLLGRPQTITAMKSYIHYKKLEVEDQAAVMCQMPNGAIVNLWCSFALNDPTNDPWTVLYKVLGTKGGVSYSWNEAQYEDNGGPGGGLTCYEDGFAGEVDYMVNQCILADMQPLSTLDDAIDALKIVETAERIVDSGRGSLKLKF
ncbi:MAG: Gfo/Idh/MocA family oxidoreductase [Lentisphaeria bacterium]|nr:Gfo/Idh/MocA family oxidoreductase [Lentisphaeria bacterium]